METCWDANGASHTEGSQRHDDQEQWELRVRFMQGYVHEQSRTMSGINT